MSERTIEENRFVITDMHMGEGKNNNLEYFEEDETYLATIKSIQEQYKGEPMTLVNLGDTFDFLALEDKETARAGPTEDVAAGLIKKIFKAHPKVILSWRMWIENGGKIKFFIGNHDLALAWPNVQNFIRHKLTAGKTLLASDEQIQFLFEEKKNGVFFTHGNNAESLHATPKKVFLTKRMGKLLAIPLLRQPYGNYSRTDLANVFARGSRICKGNYWIGRLEPHWYVYVEALWKNWWFAINALLLWLVTPLRHRFSPRWWMRKSAGLFKLFIMNMEAFLFTLWDTMRGRDYTHYPRTILEDNDDIDVVCIGHIHTCRRETHEKYGTFIYPGNWSTTYDIQPPKTKLKWKHFRGLEKAIKTIFAARKMFNRKTKHLYAPKKRELYSFGLFKFFNDGYKEIDLMRYNPEKNCLEQII